MTGREELLRLAEKIIRGNKTNAPHPHQPGMRIVGWVVPEEVAGLSDGLFALDGIESTLRTALATYVPDVAGDAKAVRDKLCISSECKFDRGCGCLDAISAALASAVAAERERCAKVAESTAVILESYMGELQAKRIAAAIRSPAPAHAARDSKGDTAMITDAQIKHMVDRFLGWRLPDDFSPDAGISFKRTFNEHTPHPMYHDPHGTNLLTATQAEAMVRYMVEGIASHPQEPARGGGE